MLVLKGDAESFDPNALKPWQNFFWKLKLPPKVKNFGWRLCKGWMPVAGNSKAEKGTFLDCKCFRFGFHTGSIFHAIWNCQCYLCRIDAVFIRCFGLKMKGTLWGCLLG